LAYFLDYQNVILFGVDLNHHEYFFSDIPDEDKIVEREKDEQERQQTRHNTAKSDGRKGIHEYVVYINEEFFKPEDRNMYIGSRESLLYPNLDHYEIIQ
jgi:hypothetical protein